MLLEERLPGSVAKPWLQVEQRQRVIEAMVDDLMPNLLYTMEPAFAYMDSAMAVETELRESMLLLTPTEFDGVLHPVFQEDEMKLIVVGGVLGAGAGAIQWAVLTAIG